MKLFLAYLICGTVALLVPCTARAHGDVHQRILAITEKIEAGDRAAGVLLQRAELFRLDEDYVSALRDCTAAQQLTPTNSLICFTRAKILFDEKKFQKAAAELNQFLETHPQQVDALLMRARAQSHLGNIAAADKDYATAIDLARAPEPDWYFERAQMLQAAGRGKEALTVAENGSQRSGAIALDLLAIDLATELKEFENALRRLEKMCLQSARKEKWLMRRGEILEKAGRLKEARESFTQAEQAWSALPARFRSSPSSQQLHTEIAAALQRFP